MQRKFVDRLLLPTIFGLTTVIAALILWQLLLGHRRVEIQAATKEQALFVKTKTESELRASILILEQLAARWQARGQSNDADMESDVQLAMSGYPAYQAIEWVDPTYHVLWVTPQNRNPREQGADLNKDEPSRTVLRSAQGTREAVVSHPVTLRQGGKGLLICVPVYSHDQLTGFLLGAFRYQALLSPILQDVAPDYWIEVYDGGPVGIDAIAATMGEERDTLEDVIEPYLLQTKPPLVTRTRQGRRATKAAYEHLKLKWKPPANNSGDDLFGEDV